MKVNLRFFILLFLLISNTVTGQELKQIKKEYPNTTEEYSVLKSDKKIRHGNYKLSDRNGIIKTGFYKNNQKDSTWTEYFSGTKQIDNQGKFKNGLRVGVWNFYIAKGELLNRFDYSTNQLLYFNPQGFNKEFLIKTDNGFETAFLDQPPLSFPSKDGKTVEGRVKYPEAAMRQGINGTVVVSWILNENGILTDYKVEQGIGGGCDEEALRVIKSMENYLWVPGRLAGKPVAIRYILPLRFDIQ